MSHAAAAIPVSDTDPFPCSDRYASLRELKEDGKSPSKKRDSTDAVTE